MQTTSLLDDLKNIMKEGYLEKESAFLKSWRRRWFVLTTTTLYSFKVEKQYNNPTEVIPLRTVSTIKSCDEETKREHSFVEYSENSKKIDQPQRSFYMVAQNHHDKEQWIGAIGKAMVKLNIKQNSFEDD